MVIKRETVKYAIIAFGCLAVTGLFVLMVTSMASKTKPFEPAEALMVEVSFADSTSAAEAGGRPSEQQSEDRSERIEICREDVEEISEAIEDANGEGKPAGSITQLEQEGFLDDTPKLAPVLVYTLEVSEGRPTGLVLINGLPAPRACES